MNTRTETQRTRWGDVSYTWERLDSTYSRHTFEGPREAVIVQVADGLRRTTQCYEHMFVLESIAPHPDPKKAECHWVRAVCQSSNYAGD